jgi:hypothetical protein
LPHVSAAESVRRLEAHLFNRVKVVEIFGIEEAVIHGELEY